MVPPESQVPFPRPSGQGVRARARRGPTARPALPLVGAAVLLIVTACGGSKPTYATAPAPTDSAAVTASATAPATPEPPASAPTGTSRATPRSYGGAPTVASTTAAREPGPTATSARPVASPVPKATVPARPTPTPAPSTPPAPQTSAITIRAYAFTPQNQNVPLGSKVTATNQDPVAHTWTDPGVWDSGNLGTGGSFSYTFTRRGVFNFTCSIHPSMTGSVTVS